MLEMFLALERTGELARTAADDAFHTAGGFLADHRGLEITGADCREFEGHGVVGRGHHPEHLRDDVAGALDLHKIADLHP